jgi:hypothetical protein
MGPALVAQLRAALDEAAALGLTARDTLAQAARALLHGDRAAAAETLTALLPAPLDHVLLQADLTAVAPGPLVPEVARQMAAVAEVESTGGATVYRFSERSIRAALDAGWGADEVRAFLTRVSRTPVPQPLLYLVDDVARSHGRLRVAPALGVLVADDPALLDELLATGEALALRLRRIAPTVATAHAAPHALLEDLRRLGHAAVLEGDDGRQALIVDSGRRVPTRGRPQPLRTTQPPPDEATARAVVRALRVGERGSRAAPSGRAPLERSTVPEVQRLLRGAVERARSAWIAYLDQHGTTSERLVDPVSVAGGWLTAYDHRQDVIRTFALHRISAVALVPREPAAGGDG